MRNCSSYNSSPLSGLLESIIQFLSYPAVLYNSRNKKMIFNQAAIAIQEKKLFTTLFEENPSFYTSCERKYFSIVYLPIKDNEENLTLAVFIPYLDGAYPHGCLTPDLRDIIEASYDGIIVTNGEGIILAANKAYESLTKNKVSNITGRKICEISQEKIPASLVSHVLDKKKPASNTQHSPTNHKCLTITGKPVFNSDGKVQWVILYYRDITEINQLKYEIEHIRGITQRYSFELTEIRKQVIRETNIIANSQAIKKVIELSLHVAKVDSTVLIQGESGAGKELIAKIIHNNSSRSLGPFIKVNCTAIPESLIESELFGYEPGAFTGASRKGKAGFFELAHNGTLLLDEIGDLPLNVQGKLLRVLQEQEITRVGGEKTRKINVRIIAATNQDLDSMVKDKTFRNDLYFRLNVVPILVPPLRERQEDIIPLAFFYQEFFNKKYNLKKEFAPDAIKVFSKYHWPGNIRELINVVERQLVTSIAPVIAASDLPPEFYPARSQEVVSIKGIIPLKQAVEELERQLLNRAMATYGSTYKAAEILKVDQSTIVKKLKKLKSKKTVY